MAVRESGYEMDDDIYDDEDTQKDKYLTFRLANEEFGIPIAYVIEIIGIQNITELPDMPHFIRGVINLRGKVIPVMDMRARFGMERRDYDARTCIIVVELDELAVGLIADNVNEVADIPENQVEPPPRGASKVAAYIMGMGKIGQEVNILLDVRKILYADEQEKLQAAIAGGRDREA